MCARASDTSRDDFAANGDGLRDKVLSADQIDAIARESDGVTGRCACNALDWRGWSPVPVSFEESRYRRLGALAAVSGKEPTWLEHHPAGTRYASPDAPIALGHFPYNRCDLWQCIDCGRAYLRYTEFGGYFVDRRIRALRAALIARTEPPAED